MNYYKVFKHFLLIIILCTINYSLSFGQNCGCSLTFKTNNRRGVNILDGQKAPYNRLRSGGTLCIPAGNYQELRFINFRGNGGKPITIKNCGGKVTTNNGITVLGSRYLKISGAGHPSIKYGIKIQRAKGTGLDIKGLSSDVEIENVEVQNAGFAGIMAKTDPQCNKPKTWRKNFTFYNLKIHDCYIHDTHGEGMYIGYTGGYERSNRKCGGRQIFGHLFKSVRIYDNIIVRTGWDGFQLNLAVQDVRVYGNTVIGYGTQKRANQNFGWSIGGGTKGKFYNNFIYQINSFKSRANNPYQLKGSGVQIISNGDTFFYNNVIVNSERHAIFIHNRLSRRMLNFKEGYYFLNNTIIGSRLSGIFYNSASTYQKDEKLQWKRIFFNNLIVGSRATHHKTRTWKGMNENYVDFNSKAMRDNAKANVQNNVCLGNTQQAKFANANNLVIDANNYRLANGARGINAGRGNTRSFGFSTDFNGVSRGTGGKPDAGAFEYNGRNQAKVFIFASKSGNRVNFRCNFNVSGKGFIKIEHITGQSVHQLFNGYLRAGNRSFNWNNARRGFYRINIKIGNYSTSKFIII